MSTCRWDRTNVGQVTQQRSNGGVVSDADIDGDVICHMYWWHVYGSYIWQYTVYIYVQVMYAEHEVR